MKRKKNEMNKKKGKSKRKEEKDMKEKKKGGDELDLTFNIVDYFGFGYENLNLKLRAGRQTKCGKPPLVIISPEIYKFAMKFTDIL